MFYLNLVACVLFLLLIAAEIWFILRRNRRIKLRGKDDLFTSALVMLFVILIFPLTENSELIESLRNVLLLVALFSTAAIRRGLSESGIEKLFFTIPWRKLDSVRIAPAQVAKVQAVFHVGALRFKLIFPSFRLKELVYELQKHTDKVYLQEGLQRQV